VKLLFLNPIGNIGGAERVLLTAIAGVKRELPTATIRVLALSDGPLLPAVRELGAEAEVFPLPNGLGEMGDSHSQSRRWLLALRSVSHVAAFWSFVARLRRAITTFGPDLVHSNGIKTHLLSRAAVPAGVPVVWHAHDFYGSRPLAGWLLRRARSRVRAIVAISNSIAADVRVTLPGIAVIVVPNCVDLAHFSPALGDGAELDCRAGLSPAPPGLIRVGLVATYARWKGQLVVLNAAARLMAESPELPIRWYIVGGPIYHTAAQFTQAELRREAESRGLVGRVGFIPFAADTAAIYRALDVVIHASTQPEPFGLTVAEAMACGRATVVSASGGAAELFTDGHDARGFTPGNAEQLAGVVRKLVLGPEMRSRLGKAARCTAEVRFDANQYGGRLCQVYRNVLSCNARRYP